MVLIVQYNSADNLQSKAERKEAQKQKDSHKQKRQEDEPGEGRKGK